jgi:hypothetical protein
MIPADDWKENIFLKYCKWTDILYKYMYAEILTLDSKKERGLILAADFAAHYQH